MRIFSSLFSLTLSSFLIVLSSCEVVNENLSFETITFTQSNQKFEIVPFYRTMPTYIKKAKENIRQIDRIYEKCVYKPIWINFASKGECSFLAKSISYPISDLNGLTTEVNALLDSDVEKIVEDALRKVSEALPGPNTTVYLQAIDPNYKNYMPKNLHVGIVAHTFGSGRIFIAIDPTTTNWRDQLQKVVAHEYHHSVWVSRNFETTNFSLLEYLILEGRADSFAELMYPDVESPWTEVLDSEKERDVWFFMKNRLNRRDAELNMRMVTGDKHIPMASAYTIGYRIVQAFIGNNPDVTILEWTDMVPEEILAKSNYDTRFN